MTTKKQARDTIPQLNRLIEEAIDLQRQKKAIEAKYEKVKSEIKKSLSDNGFDAYYHDNPADPLRVIKAYTYTQKRTGVDKDAAKAILDEAQYGKIFVEESVNGFSITEMDKTTVDLELN